MNRNISAFEDGVLLVSVVLIPTELWGQAGKVLWV